MSINLEKHLNPRRKRKPVEKEFHVVNREADLLRIRVNKLMQHPERAAFVPEPEDEAALKPQPMEYNPHVQSAISGAGSGEFHVYRADRRREELRQEWLDAEEQKEVDEVEFRQNELKWKDEEAVKTAKRRAKREKSKQRKMKAKVQCKPPLAQTSNEDGQQDAKKSKAEQEEVDREKSQDDETTS